jgi:hypothetical protein
MIEIVEQKPDMFKRIEDAHGFQRIFLVFELAEKRLDFVILLGFMTFLHFWISERPCEVIGRIKKANFIEFPLHIPASFVDDHGQTFLLGVGYTFLFR